MCMSTETLVNSILGKLVPALLREEVGDAESVSADIKATAHDEYSLATVSCGKIYIKIYALSSDLCHDAKRFRLFFSPDFACSSSARDFDTLDELFACVLQDIKEASA